MATLKSVSLNLLFPSGILTLRSERFHYKFPLCVALPPKKRRERTRAEVAHLRQKNRPNSLSDKAPVEDAQRSSFGAPSCLSSRPFPLYSSPQTRRERTPAEFECLGRKNRPNSFSDKPPAQDTQPPEHLSIFPPPP